MALRILSRRYPRVVLKGEGGLNSLQTHHRGMTCVLYIERETVLNERVLGRSWRGDSFGPTVAAFHPPSFQVCGRACLGHPLHHLQDGKMIAQTCGHAVATTAQCKYDASTSGASLHPLYLVLIVASHTFDLRAGLVDIVNSLTTALDFGSSNEHSRFTRFAPDIVQSIELWLCQPRTKAGYVCVRQGRPPACSAHCHRDHVHVYTPTPGTFVIFVGGERFVQSPKTKTCRCSSAWLQHNVLRNIYHNEHSSKDER